MTKGKVKKDNKYYTFWGIMTIAVVLGQIYVGTGYRIMATSIFDVIDTIDRADPNFRPRPLT